MGRDVIFAPDEYYHLYNRGTDKRDVFLDRADYNRFLALLYVANSASPVDLKLQGRTLYELGEIDRGEPIVDVCAYALMPNHFHILIKEKDTGGITAFMRKLGTAYTMYFNAKNDRTGALFQGKFKSKYVDRDNYLQYLLAYIHLNPVKIIEPLWKENGISDVSQVEKFLIEYPYSSFQDYVGIMRREDKILNKDAFPTEIDLPSDFKTSHMHWLQGRTL